MLDVTRAGALGAVGAAGGIALLFAILVFFTIPTANSGIDWAMAAITWMIGGGVALILIAVHLVLARQLLDESKRR